jgi:hypothetical protein
MNSRIMTYSMYGTNFILTLWGLMSIESAMAESHVAFIWE